MNKFFRSMAIVAATILTQSAQAQDWQLDSVNLAPQIKRDVWYSMDNGQVKSDTANNWTLAVTQMSRTAGVWLNNIDGYRCINIHKSASQFASASAADSLTGTEQVNPDYSWERGAMNVNRDVTDTFDYGWGKYDQVSKNVYGDSVYLIGKGANWYKLIIDSLVGDSNYTYHTRIAAVAPFASPIASLNFPKTATFKNKNLQFIQAGMTGLSSLDREPVNNTWDILFTKYLGLVTSQGGPAIYPVTGTLSNYKTEVARVQAVELDAAFSQANSYPRRQELSVIGSDWKVFNGTAYVYPDSLSYMVKAKSGDLWQLKFTGFSSTTGFIKFKKRKVFATATNNIDAAEMNMQVYPNPAQNEALVSVEAKQSTKATLVVTSTTGQLIASRNIELAQGINAFNLKLNNIATGNYNISIKGQGINLTKMLVKQ
jgi:Secretion system C-terminal sorting domain